MEANVQRNPDETPEIFISRAIFIKQCIPNMKIDITKDNVKFIYNSEEERKKLREELMYLLYSLEFMKAINQQSSPRV